MNLLGLGKAKNVIPLDPEAAVQLGAETIGEVFIYTFMATLIVLEYTLTTKKPTVDPVAELKDSVQTLQNQVTDMSLTAATTEAELRELQRKVGQLDSENSSLQRKMGQLNNENSLLSEKLKLLESDNKSLTEKVKASKSRWI